MRIVLELSVRLIRSLDTLRQLKLSNWVEQMFIWPQMTFYVQLHQVWGRRQMVKHLLWFVLDLKTLTTYYVVLSKAPVGSKYFPLWIVGVPSSTNKHLPHVLFSFPIFRHIFNPDNWIWKSHPAILDSGQSVPLLCNDSSSASSRRFLWTVYDACWFSHIDDAWSETTWW